MMNEEIQGLTDWFESQKGNTIVIKKEEYSIGHNHTHINEAELLFEKVAIKQIEREDPDGYLANHEIILHGEGKIRTDKGEIPIPQSVYEIPIYNDLTVQTISDGITAKTEKAKYTFTISQLQ